MGNSLAPPPMDYRIERTIKKFNLPLSKVEALWHLFCRHDHAGTGYMSKDDFFVHVIKYKETCLTDHMFKLIESTHEGFISFGEFVEVITTFACFGKKELLRYFFYLLDAQHTGLIEKTELKHFINNMWEKEALTNVTDGLDYLDRIDDGDGAFNFAQIISMQDKYPLTMYPLYRLQVSIQRNTLGEYWWNKHIDSLSDTKMELLQSMEKSLKIKQKALIKSKEVVTEEMIKQRMGIRYHLTPWRRAAVKAQMLRIVAIESELDKTYSSKYLNKATYPM